MAKIPCVQVHLRPKMTSYHKGDNVYDQTPLLWFAVDLLKRRVNIAFADIAICDPKISAISI